MKKTVNTAHNLSSQADIRSVGVYYLLAYAMSWAIWLFLIAFPQFDKQWGSPYSVYMVGG